MQTYISIMNEETANGDFPTRELPSPEVFKGELETAMAIALRFYRSKGIELDYMPEIDLRADIDCPVAGGLFEMSAGVNPLNSAYARLEVMAARHFFKTKLGIGLPTAVEEVVRIKALEQAEEIRKAQVHKPHTICVYRKALEIPPQYLIFKVAHEIWHQVQEQYERFDDSFSHEAEANYAAMLAHQFANGEGLLVSRRKEIAYTDEEKGQQAEQMGKFLRLIYKE